MLKHYTLYTTVAYGFIKYNARYIALWNVLIEN